MADEYYTSDISFEVPEISIEPWEPNVTALFDPENLTWKEWVDADTPIPTPWDKEPFDKFSIGIQKERRELRAAKAPESELESLFDRQSDGENAMIAKMKYKDKAGAFEGANYMQNGLYRSAVNCIMYTRRPLEFCPACQKAITQIIDQYSK